MLQHTHCLYDHDRYTCDDHLLHPILERYCHHRLMQYYSQPGTTLLTTPNWNVQYMCRSYLQKWDPISGRFYRIPQKRYDDHQVTMPGYRQYLIDDAHQGDHHSMRPTPVL